MDNIENLMGATEELYTLLLCLNRKVFSHDDIVKRLSIPPSHAKVIFHLHCGGEASVSEIAKNLSISKSNMTPIIDKLIQENLVERFTDPNDRRIIRVRATEKGHEFCLKQREKTKKHLEEKISSLSSEELEKIKDLAKELNSIFSKIE
ncbi:TPA: MarR family transcriptional regulator [Clostridium perfringens]|nr:MarR family transcriptional regulator [Clostridium perfringens]HBI7036724.1 MarR family transcriptional regulator [Clostridium perfringens]HBI7050852.1 MarR family transcriptional regulator [Clostridium perfringens]